MKLLSWLVGVFLFFIIYVPGPYFFISLNRNLNFPVLKIPFGQYLGMLMILSGLAFIVYLVFVFKVVGKGSPVITEGAKKLIIKGPYQYVRNPMYLTHLWIWLAMFVIFGDVLLILYLLLGWLTLHVFVTKWEEPQLKEKFGREYDEYVKKIPRWIPKL